MHKYILNTLFFLLCISQGIEAANEAPDSLEDGLIEAYKNNPRLNAARAQLHIVDEGVPLALSNWRPQIRLQGQAGYQANQQKFPSPIGSPQALVTSDTSFKIGMFTTNQKLTSRAESLVIEQPLYRGGRTVAQTKAAENKVFAQRHSLLATEQDVFLDVIIAHMDVVKDQSILDLQKKTEAVLEKHLEATKLRLQVGEVTKTDLSQAEFRLAGARAERIKAEADLKNSRSTYEKIVGFSPKFLEFPKNRPTLPKSMTEALAIAEQENPIILASRYDEIASGHEVRQIKGELYPTLSLRGEISQADDQYQRNFRTRNAAILANLNIPLYSSGSVEARVRQARHNKVQKGFDIERARRETREKTELAWDRWVAAKAAIEARIVEVKASQIALEGVQYEQQTGSRTVLDVLDAEKEALKAKVNLVQAERDERVAGYALLPAMGRLTSRALGLKVPHFDPKAHYKEVHGKWFGLSDRNTQKIVVE